MIAGFFQSIENEKAKSSLLKTKNIFLLEEIIKEELNEQKKLKILKNKPEFVPKKELQEIASKIYGEVNEFLEIQNKDFPKIKYCTILERKKDALKIITSYILAGSFTTSSILTMIQDTQIGVSAVLMGAGSIAYLTGRGLQKIKEDTEYNPTKLITTPKTSKTILIPAIAHEYTHHLQNINKTLNTKNEIFLEGQARGVQRHIARIYRNRETNDAYLVNILKQNKEEYLQTYLWLCDELKQKPEPSLEIEAMQMCNEEMEDFKQTRKPTNHAIGNTIFRLQEFKIGKKIYYCA